MRLAGPIDLPAHRAPGGFDHAAIHHRDDRLYLAHAANAAVDIVDCARERYRGSIGICRQEMGMRFWLGQSELT